METKCQKFLVFTFDTEMMVEFSAQSVWNPASAKEEGLECTGLAEPDYQAEPQRQSLKGGATPIMDSSTLDRQTN